MKSPKLKYTKKQAEMVDKVANLYGVGRWGQGFFLAKSNGELAVRLRRGKKSCEVSILQTIKGLEERGINPPILLRFCNILGQKVAELNTSFRRAIKELGFKGEYQGVFPVKVNQQRQLIEEIADCGKKYNFGFEVGSKAELIAALAYIPAGKNRLICNGYKDREYVELALNAQKLGINVFLVIEIPRELEQIIAVCEELNIRPQLGVRLRLSAAGGGHWNAGSGESSAFGLNAPQIMRILQKLRKTSYLDCLKILHYHQGSQIPDISVIRKAANEAARFYANLVAYGAPVEALDIGGGLAVDYEGAKSASDASCNYTLREYCLDIVEAIFTVCEQKKIRHPNIISESGRFVSAPCSALIFNILDSSKLKGDDMRLSDRDKISEPLKSLKETQNSLSVERLQESFNDARFYREQLRGLFLQGLADLEELADGEEIFLNIAQKAMDGLAERQRQNDEFEHIQTSLLDSYYGNFSLFQSIPDAWGIKQYFPLMPIHRLDEFPNKKCIVADITCDCDGKLDQFVNEDNLSSKRYTPLHELREDEEYYLGVFLVGAYQETLGDLHNLFGDTNIVAVNFDQNRVTYSHELEGDSVADVLSYVEYEPKDLLGRFRKLAEEAVQDGKISAKERKGIVNAYQNGLNGYTYFEY